MIRLPLPQGLDFLSLHAQAPTRFPVLLESAAQHARSARFDLLLVGNGQALRQVDRTRVLDQHGQTVGSDLLSLLDHRLSERPSRDAEIFRGGYALLLSYEYAACLEPKLAAVMPTGPLPLGIALRTPMALVRDHVEASCYALVEPDALAWAETVLADLPDAAIDWRTPKLQSFTEAEPSQFLAGVERIRDYIAAGDVFQVNLSRAWQGRLADDTRAIEVYRALRQTNPAPFAGSFVDTDLAVLSSSPERLVSVRGQAIETRPIAGTRPRGQGQHDLDLARELLQHPKERAEHIMLIDLERNDLGRVCSPGSVDVDELMSVESYAHVHHIVSNVRGRLRPEVTLRDIVQAVFPGGTITGCPKIRCMQIIAELEQAARGFYTGAMGFVGPGRQIELNILIRSLTVTGRDLSLRAGAGIVFDSIAARELEETRHKARGLLRALGQSS